MFWQLERNCISIFFRHLLNAHAEIKMLLTKPQIKKIFSKSQITLKDMKAVASSPKLKGFDSIDLSSKGITDKIGALLICSKHLGGWLNLSNNNLTNDFVKILLKQEVSPNLIKLNLRKNRVTSAVISDLVNKYNKDLNVPPDNDNITTICGISICSSSDGRSPRWVKLFDRIQGDGMDFNEIVDFIKEKKVPSEVAEGPELERPIENISKILLYRTHDRCIGGAMAGSDSRVVNVLYAVEDFFYLKHNLEDDMVVEFEKEAFDEADRRERDYSEDEDEDYIELDPKDAYIYFNRGHAYNELKKYPEAIANYTKAIELDPKDASAYFNRGIAYEALGKTKKAKADFAKAKSLEN